MTLVMWGTPTLADSEWVSYVPPSDRMVGEPWLLSTWTHLAPVSRAWDEEVHREAELVWTTSGNAMVEAQGRLWKVSPSLGMWVPAGVPHRVRADAGSAVMATYVNTDAVARDWGIVGIAMTALLRGLLHYNDAEEMPVDERLRMQRVALDLIRPARTTALDIPLPSTPELRALADHVVRNPADGRTLDDCAAQVNMSGRTLVRRFETEVGVTFSRWRTLVRVRQAMIDIADGATVASVARRVGYGSPGAFINAFRRVTGYTPTEYFGTLGGPTGPAGPAGPAGPEDRQDRQDILSRNRHEVSESVRTTSLS